MGENNRHLLGMRWALTLFSILVFCIPVDEGKAAGIAVPGDSRLGALYDSLSNPLPDEDKAADLSDILLIRGGQEILLSKGRLRLFKPVDGKIFGAVFVGEGQFTLFIPTRSEQEEFNRQTKFTLTEKRYQWNFSRAVFWFQDTLLAELGHGLTFTRIPITRDEEEIVKRSGSYATDKANENLVYDLLTELREENPQPLFVGHFFMPDKKEIFFKFNPRSNEEVSIYRPPYESISGSVWWLELVNSFHLLDEYSARGEYELSGEDKKRFDWEANTLSVGIEKNGDITGRAEVSFTELGSRKRIFRFNLDPKLHLDSVRLPSGEPLEFHRNDDSWEGIILLPESGGPHRQVLFSYHGEYLWLYQGNRRLSGMFYMPRSGSATGWYPSTTDLDRMIFDVTYTYPSDLTLVASGHPSSDTVRGATRTSRFSAEEPFLISSFTLGYFEHEQFQLSDTEAVVTVYDVGDDEMERIGKDCANSFRLFTYLFGPPPFKEIRVTGGPLTHGQAFEEFIHLPWFDEYIGDKNKSIAIGRAHEVAHMWWGHSVGWASYHDQWISEAFAEYSALLYAPFVLKKDEDFFKTLRDWKERINGARKYSLGSGAQLGSIWLGYRTSTSQTRGDYSLSTYRKGAWVLHMLRMMMLDLTTRNEDAFKAMMREFYVGNIGKDPTTGDFIRITTKYFGFDMTPFFDQWVYGTEIPTLRCSHTVTPSPDGKYALKITVDQEDVSNPFLLFLPFELRYRNGAVARARLKIDQQHQTFEYMLDGEPSDVKFNILESLLCPVEES